MALQLLKLLGIGIDRSGRLENKPVNAPALQQNNVLDASLNAVVTVADQQMIALRLGSALQSYGLGGIKGIEHIGIAQTDGVGLSRDKRDCDLIRNIVKLIRSFQDPAACLGGNAAFLVPQDKGDRADGNAGEFGDISDGNALEGLILSGRKEWINKNIPEISANINRNKKGILSVNKRFIIKNFTS